MQSRLSRQTHLPQEPTTPVEFGLGNQDDRQKQTALFRLIEEGVIAHPAMYQRRGGGALSWPLNGQRKTSSPITFIPFDGRRDQPGLKRGQDCHEVQPSSL